MSPSTAEVARALVASRWPWREHRGPQGVALDGAATRCKDGMRWVWCGRWCPDLDDPATAGVLLDVLSRLTTISVRTRPDPYAASVLYWLGDQPHATPLCPTLGEAVARALLAVWGQA